MPTLALSMIVKNAAADLADCLASVRGIADEIVVADTGSTDETMPIAKAGGARVISIPWEDDFAKARNQALAEAKADWVLMLDADERLDPEASSVLRAMTSSQRAAGYQVTIRNYVTTMDHRIWDRPAKQNYSKYAPAREFPAYVDHENVRVFRRDPQIFFTGRVHETVGWRILEYRGQILPSKLVIHHLGMARTAEERAKKLIWYRELGRKKVTDMPENAQAHFELGVSELENFGNAHEALNSIERACQLNSGFGVAWFFAGFCHLRLGEHAEALECFERAERVGHASPLSAELVGDTNYNLGRYEQAAACYRRGVKQNASSAILQSKLGLAEARCGNTDSGLRRMRRAIEKEPANGELYDRLIQAEVWVKRPREAVETAEAKLDRASVGPEDFVKAASIHAKLEHWAEAVGLLERGAEKFPDSELIRGHLFKIETALRSQNLVARD
ncbi:MAG TPA: glycosyltransferase [Candidatus Micrarchaeia archaeon]|nr:glycosyltransferase [Candidatus Micrarchaeia archaeon]